MIHVSIDASQANQRQLEDFYALPAVSAAVDALARHGPNFGISLSLLSPSPAVADEPPAEARA